MLKAVLFDFDYTLGDTTDGITAAINHALSEMGYAGHTTDEIRPTIGLSLHEVFPILTGDASESAADEFYARFQPWAKKTLKPSAELLPHAEDLLYDLHAHGIMLGIVTTKHRHQIVDILDKFDLNRVFDIIIGSEDVTNKKPDPEGLLKAVSSLGIKKEEMLYVGDSFVDAEAASRAGIPFAAVLTGTTKRDRFAGYTCVTVADDLSDIGEYIKTQPRIVRCTPAELDDVTEFYDAETAYLEATINYPMWTHGEYPSRKDVTETIANGSQYAAYYGDRVVGAFMIDCDPRGDYTCGDWSVRIPEGEYLVVHALGVDHTMARRGIATEMMRYVLSFAERRGLPAVRLDVVPTNTPARALYEGLGFRFAGIHDLNRGFENIPVFTLYEYNIETSIT